MAHITYTSQTRLNFEIDKLVAMGIDRAYVCPFDTNNQVLSEPAVILCNLERLAVKAQEAAKKGLEVYPFFVTINHPEGNYRVPARYRGQRNLDGSTRPAFICFRDEVRQQEMISFASKAAELGFGRIAFDDDLRDAFCYCDEHIGGFAGFNGKSRDQIAEILNSVLTRPDYEELRTGWYRYKYEAMADYARRLERAVHRINGHCRIGICTSAKRCQDFSGRSAPDWLGLFDGPDAPAFTRLCGECYDDDMMHIAQSGGWHQYTAGWYGPQVEKMLEITSCATIGFRSASAVLFETQTVAAATAQDTVHWAWTEDFGHAGLDRLLGGFKGTLDQQADNLTAAPRSPLCLYIGDRLGAYMPVNISTSYGASHDPIRAYNITSLTGIPITISPDIESNQEAILCSSYIGRAMIERIDGFVHGGGTAILDAVAASCYRLYGGGLDFEIAGPVTLNRYEISPEGFTEDMIADLPPDSVYLFEAGSGPCRWLSYDINGHCRGATTVVLRYGKGSIVLLGFDLSRTGSILVRSGWRKRILDILSIAGIEMAVYWSGPAAVQCLYYGDRVALANYNFADITGELAASGGPPRQVTLGGHEVRVIKLLTAR